MGLTIISFLVTLGILLVFISVARHGRSASARVALAVDLLFIGATLFAGLAAAYGGIETMLFRINLIKGAIAAASVAVVFLLLFALAFPEWLKPWIKFTLPVFIAVSGLFAYLILFSTDYVAGIYLTADGYAISGGRSFLIINLAVGALGLTAVAINMTRALMTTDRIHRERSLLVFAGNIAGITTIWFMTMQGFTNPGANAPFILFGLACFFIAGLASYAISVTRIFDWREIGMTVLDYIILFAIIGIPSGLAVFILSLFGSLARPVPYIGGLLVFLLAYVFAGRFSDKYLERLSGRRSYGEKLESALVHIDLARGRDYVLKELYRVLSEAFGMNDFIILIENEHGDMAAVFSPDERQTVVERGDPLIGTLENVNANVIMKSEAIASEAYSTMRVPLLALFDSLDAEALVLAREGRRIIGIFGFGSRRSGASYTDYDYETLNSIYGKLFVFAFYLRNVARESIVYTVNRELALSDQVIRFALENVGKVDSPNADTAWTTRSMRRLGGDFVDFVRIGGQRWFFVLGDISGKGLSASMNMLILKSMIRSFLKTEKEFTGLVSKVNDFIRSNLPRGCFFAGVFGYFDLEAGSFYFINCGAPAILFYSPAFESFVEVGGQNSKVLGFARNIKPYLKPRKLSLPPDSAIVISTDGILESESLAQERFGTERLIKSVSSRLGSSAKEITDGTIEDLLKFTENRQDDDMTLLVMKMLKRSST